MLNGRRLKLLIDALNFLVQEAILDCSSEGISLQALVRARRNLPVHRARRSPPARRPGTGLAARPLP